jgi:hypothetical protein
VQKNTFIDIKKRNIEKYFPENLVNSAKNPKTPHEHILGFTL